MIIAYKYRYINSSNLTFYLMCKGSKKKEISYLTNLFYCDKNLKKFSNILV